jgi:nitroreductase / dihydropteridine reductase
MNLIEAMNWRYAVKKYTNEKVPTEKVENIIEAVNLSASSVGLQSYRLFVIENAELKQKLGGHSFNSQIREASHLLVFAAFDSISQQLIDAYFDRMATIREMPIESLADFKSQIVAYFTPRTDEENFIWSTKQAYIALGTALIAAANEQVDATPMEGFEAEKFDEILDLRAKGLKSVVILALGYRDEENDYLAKLKKVRLPIEEFATTIK